MDEVSQGTGKVPVIVLAVVMVTAIGLGAIVVLDAVGDDRTAPERVVSEWWQAVADGDCDAAVGSLTDSALSDFVPSASNRDEALAGCAEMRVRDPDQIPEAQEVEEVQDVDGDASRAEVDVTYEPPGTDEDVHLDGANLRVQILYLVEDEGDWLIDQLAADVLLSDLDAERAA